MGHIAYKLITYVLNINYDLDCPLKRWRKPRVGGEGGDAEHPAKDKT